MASNNSLVEGVDDEDGNGLSSVLMSFLAVGLSLIMVLSLALNGLLCLVFLKRPVLVNASNSFVLNLAICQLGISILVLPLSIVSIISQKWLLSDNWCRFQGFLFTVFVVTSMLCLAVISIDRHYAITNSLRYPYVFTQFRCNFIIAMGWLAGVSLALPPLIYTDLYGYEMVQFRCGVRWSHSDYETAYLAVVVAICYVLPMFIMLWCYCSIFIAAIRHTRSSCRVHPSNKTFSERTSAPGTNNTMVTAPSHSSPCQTHVSQDVTTPSLSTPCQTHVSQGVTTPSLSTPCQTHVSQGVTTPSHSTPCQTHVSQGITTPSLSTPCQTHVSQGVTSPSHSTPCQPHVSQGVSAPSHSTPCQPHVSQCVTTPSHSTPCQPQVSQCVTTPSHSTPCQPHVSQGVTTPSHSTPCQPQVTQGVTTPSHSTPCQPHVSQGVPTPPHSTPCQPQQANRIKSKNRRLDCKATRTILVILITYFVCWVPYVAVCITHLSGNRVPDTLETISVFFVYSSTSVNPIVYGFMNRAIRDELVKYVCQNARREELQDSDDSRSQTLTTSTTSGRKSRRCTDIWTIPTYRKRRPNLRGSLQSSCMERITEESEAGSMHGACADPKRGSAKDRTMGLCGVCRPIIPI